MLRNISGAHVQYIREDYTKALFGRKAGSIKICNSAYSEDRVRQFHDVNPTSPVACRKIDDAGTLDDMIPKTREAIEYFKNLGSILGQEYWFVEIWPNEKFTEGDELKRLSDNTVECARIVADSGARPIGFNLPVANPRKVSDTAYCYNGAVALVENGGLFGYHNYTIPTQQLSLELDLRHQAMKQFLPWATKWALNEGMFDHGIIDGHLAGWRYEPFHVDVDFVARYTRAIAQKLAADLSVKLWTPFGAGVDDKWRTFEYDNAPQIVQVFQELYEVNGQDGNVNVGPGFKRMIPYLGTPLEDEVYHFPGTPMETSLAVFQNGSAAWQKATNETVGTRASDGAIFTDKGNNGDGHTVWCVYDPKQNASSSQVNLIKAETVNK